MARDHIEGTVLMDKWAVSRKLSSGGYGVVYKAYDLYDERHKVAVKTEPVNTRNSSLPNEYQFYKALGNAPGFPTMYDYGRTSDGSYRALVISLLGKSLHDLVHQENGTFSLKTVLCVGVQGIDLLRTIHSLGYVHRDIKPDNMMIGRRYPSEIQLVDFGLVAKYRSGRHHIADEGEGHGLRGTITYASIRSHKGRRLTRRDDLESFAYTLLTLAKGYLPWSDIESEGDVLRSKKSYSTAELCEDLPSCFLTLLRDSRNLRFDEKPDYSGIQRSFVRSLHKRGWKVKSRLDWMD